MAIAKSLGVVVAGFLVLAGCGPKPVVVVGSKNFTEQALLGEIVAQHLERRLHIPVGRKVNLGGAPFAAGAPPHRGDRLLPPDNGAPLPPAPKTPPPHPFPRRRPKGGPRDPPP